MSGTGSDAPRRPRALLWTAVALLALFAAMAVAVGLDPATPFTQRLDDAWRALVGAAPGSGSYRWFLPMTFQYFGELPGVLLVVVVLTGVLALLGRWRSALFLLAVNAIGPGLISQAAKKLVDRPRPAPGLTGGYGPLFPVDQGSFPSGHVCFAAALVVGVAALIPAVHRTTRVAWWAIGGLFTLGVAWQRTLVNAHWLSDTAFGLVGGAGAALLMWWVFWPWLRRDQSRPAWWRRATDPDPNGQVASTGGALG